MVLLEDSHSECRLYAAQCVTEMGTHGTVPNGQGTCWDVMHDFVAEFLRVQLIGGGTTGVVEKLCSSLIFK